VCIFRQALALDECRAEFLPADADSGASQFAQLLQIPERENDGTASTETKIGTETKMTASKDVGGGKREFFRGPGQKTETGQVAQNWVNVRNVKEVWFTGTRGSM
jgi:hypothetical protein